MNETSQSSERGSIQMKATMKQKGKLMLSHIYLLIIK